MRLFSNRSQMTSKCGKNKKVAHEAIACHWCSYHILTSSVIFYWTDARQHGIYLFYIITTKKLFLFQNLKFEGRPLRGLRKPSPTLANTKKAIWRDLLSYKMKQSHWLLCVAKNCDWSRKITPLSHLTWASLLVEWKLTAKAELNCKIYKS